jgi:hypothetical protein
MHQPGEIGMNDDRSIKFNLGQMLWPIQRPSTKWNVNRPFDLLFIMLRDNEVLFSFTPDYGFIESDVFPDEAAAITECKKRNQNAESPGKLVGRGHTQRD